jgi:hypothetical protein
MYVTSLLCSYVSSISGIISVRILLATSSRPPSSAVVAIYLPNNSPVVRPKVVGVGISLGI